MKRILYVVHSLSMGGLERMAVDLANALDPDRFLPFICCVARAGDLAAEFRRPENLFVIGNTGRVSAKSVMGLWRLIDRCRIDVVHSHNMAGLIHGFPGAKLRRIPLIHTNHGFAPPDSDSRALDRLERWMSTRIHRYVCVSETLKGSVMTRWKLGENAVLVVYNGVRVPEGLERSRVSTSGEFIIGSVGRLHPIKNYPLLLESFSEILRRFPRARLELIGDGAELEPLRAHAQKLELGRAITFRGRTHEVRKHLETFDIFVLPSLSEGLSLSLLEALGARTICIASNVGGNPEIIRNGVNGLLFESNDRQALTEALSYTLAKYQFARIDRNEGKRLRNDSRTLLPRRDGKSLLLATRQSS